MEDIFNLESVHEMQQPQIQALQYANDSKFILESTMKAYTNSIYSRVITTEESDIAPCDDCNGCGKFIFNNREIECFIDREQGECYENCFDKENFFDEMEQEIMFSKESKFIELLSSEIIEPLTQKP